MKQFIVCIGLLATIACHKKGTDTNPVTPPGDTTTKPPTDPPVANTIGFFLDDWAPKTFNVPAYEDVPKPTDANTTFVTVDASNILTKIPKSIAGQNSNIWMSQIVTEVPLMNHLTNLHPNVIRFPGGSISDVFFWNAPKNQPPTDAPANLLDANGVSSPAGYWYGKNTESWTFSVDNYYSMLQQTGNQGLITINYGYARYGTGANPVASAAHLAADWVRYDNGRTKYWEIGNECNGTWEAGYRIKTSDNKDSQPEIVTGALYGQHVKVFVDSMKKAAQEIGKTIYIGAYILEKQPESWQTQTDKTWNSGFFASVANKSDYYVIHSYYTAYQTNASADEILATASVNTTNMMDYLKTNVPAAGGTLKPIALDEWNITSQGSMQQVSFVNGMHAAILLNEALKNKYGLTARWDLANGWSNGNDHGLFNIGDEPNVTKWNPRPAFYYMYYFQKTVGDRLIDASVSGPSLVKVYASSYSSGQKGLVLVNTGTTQQVAIVTIKNATVGSRYYWYTMVGGTDNGEFSRKVYINNQGPTEISGGPANSYTSVKPYSASTTNGIRIALPARSVVYAVVD
ncbi:MAG: alpha-L-arabinofuranosidase [Flavisolibacter sp.]